MSSSVDVLVFGASGLCGRLLVRHLTSLSELNAEGGFTLGLAARSKQKLDNVYQEFQLDEKNIPAFVVDLNDKQKVDDAVAKAKVVVNLAAPYYKTGTTIIKACLKHRVHYLDISGESVWIQQNIADFHDLAQQAGIIISHYCGLDSIPADITVHLANKTLKSHASQFGGSNAIGESTSSIRWPLALSKSSMETCFSLFQNPPMGLAQSQQDTAFCTRTGKPWPSPQISYSMIDPSNGRINHGAILFLSAGNKAWVRRTWDLLEDFSSGEKFLSYGPDFVYDEFWECSNAWTAVATSLTFIGFVVCASIAPLRTILKRVFANGIGLSVESIEAMEKRGCRILNITKSTTSSVHPHPTIIRTTMNIEGDAGYLNTSVLVGECALSIIFSKKTNLPPLGQKGGVLTSMTALGDVLVDRLEKTGNFKFSSEVIQPWKSQAVSRGYSTVLAALASAVAIVSVGLFAWKRFGFEV